MNSQNSSLFLKKRTKRRGNPNLIKPEASSTQNEAASSNLLPNRPYEKPSCLDRVKTRDQLWDGYRRFRTGDIVRIVDSDNGRDYFAQISTLIVDKFAQKFAAVVWLTPKPGTKENAPFDPKYFQPSIAEQTPIPLRACQFECHCPQELPYAMEWTPIRALRKTVCEQLTQQIEENSH